MCAVTGWFGNLWFWQTNPTPWCHRDYAKNRFKPKTCGSLRAGLLTGQTRKIGPPPGFRVLHAKSAGSSTITLKKPGQTRLGRLGIGTWDRRQREYLDWPPPTETSFSASMRQRLLCGIWRNARYPNTLTTCRIQDTNEKHT